MSLLFDSYNLAGLQLKNRIVMAPMTRARARNERPDDLTVDYYSQRAGAGLIVSEGAAVSQEGRGYLFNPSLYNEAQKDGWQKVTAGVHAANGLMFAQLWHVGRMSHVSLQPLGGSPVSSVAKGVMSSYDDPNSGAHNRAPDQFRSSRRRPAPRRHSATAGRPLAVEPADGGLAWMAEPQGARFPFPLRALRRGPQLRERMRTLATTAPIPYRKQNGGDYQISSMELKPGLETPGAVRFALHVAEPKTCLRCRED